MRAKTGTLVANTVTTVTLDGDFDAVDVTNVDGAAAIYIRLGGTAPAVGGGDENYGLPATAFLTRRIPSVESGPTVVKLISAGTPIYTVAGA
jgi:hypothetical protein